MILLVLFIAGIICVVWVVLVVSAWLSLRWTRKAPEQRSMLRLTMGLVPVLLGFFLFGFHLRWRMNDVTVNLSWPFVMPIIIGIVAIFFWLRAQWRLRKVG